MEPLGQPQAQAVEQVTQSRVRFEDAAQTQLGSWGALEFARHQDFTLKALVEAPLPDADQLLGALIRAGVLEHNQVLRDLAREDGFPLRDMAQAWQERDAELAGMFQDHVHVNREGYLVTAQRIADEFLRRNLLGKR